MSSVVHISFPVTFTAKQAIGHTRSVDTGFTSQDAQSDFNRSRRRAALARMASRMRGQAGDVTTLLPLEEVLRRARAHRRAAGRPGDDPPRHDRRLGGPGPPSSTATSGRGTARVRSRWQRINEAQRSGKGMPPIKVVPGRRACTSSRTATVASRVSAHLGHDVIEAHVTEVLTRVSLEEGLRNQPRLPAEEPRAAVPRARAAPAASSASGSRSATPRTATASSPRRSRPGASG